MVNWTQACTVHWQIGSYATLGTTSTFIGTIMALTSITVTTGRTGQGRALARNGQVCLDNKVFTTSNCRPAAYLGTAHRHHVTAGHQPARHHAGHDDPGGDHSCGDHSCRGHDLRGGDGEPPGNGGAVERTGEFSHFMGARGSGINHCTGRYDKCGWAEFE